MGSIRLEIGEKQALGTLARDYAKYQNPAILTIVAVLEELIGVLDEIADGRAAPFDDDRRSLHRDTQLALERAGARLRDIGSPPLRSVCIDYLRDLSSAYTDPTRAGALAAKFRMALEQLRSRESVEAAFDDVIEALKDGTAYCDVCALRVAQLAELVEVRGHDWTAMQMRLSSRIADNDIECARTEMASEPRDDIVAVWLAFGNADLHKGFQRIGPIQFFNRGLTPRDIRDGRLALNTSEFEPATELTDDGIDFWLRNIPSEYYVLARVEMSGSRAQQPPNGSDSPTHPVGA